MICIGLDISKGYSDIAIIDEESNLLQKIFQVDDTKAGHKILKNKLKWGIKRVKRNKN